MLETIKNALGYAKNTVLPHTIETSAYTLSHQQKLDLITKGFIQVPGVVPKEMCDKLLRRINSEMGKGIDPTLMQKYNSQTFFPSLTTDAIVLDLYCKTAAAGIAEAAIGKGMVSTPAGAQIATRFPRADDLPPLEYPSQQHAIGYHIDGMYTPTNGVPKGHIANFTALIGVFLHDVPDVNCGNFSVFPGSHNQNAEYFRREGPKSLLNGMPKLKLPPYEQVTGKAGDIVLAHYLLTHGVAHHVGVQLRHMVFFRLCRTDHDRTRWESMTDPFVEWDSLRDLAKEMSVNDEQKS